MRYKFNNAAQLPLTNIHGLDTAHLTSKVLDYLSFSTPVYALAVFLIAGLGAMAMAGPIVINSGIAIERAVVA